MEQRFLQCAAGQELRGVPPPAGPLLLARSPLHRRRRLPALPQPDAPDPLAALAHRSLSPGLARRGRVLPDADRGGEDGQPGSAHRRGPEPLRLRDVRARHRRLASRSDAGLIRRHSLGALRHHRHSARPRVDHRAGLHGVDGPPLRHRGHLDHQPHRAPAGAAQLRAAAVRGGLPLRPRPVPRERRERGAVPRGDGRAAQLSGAVRGRGAELLGDHAAPETVDVVHGGLRAGSGDLSHHRRRSALLPRRHSPRRAHPDRHRLRSGAGLAQLHRLLIH